jgi:hypothetical protein
MEPLAHLSPHFLSPSKEFLDYSFYCENIELYEELETRGANLLNDAKQEFLKEYPLPLKSKEELEEQLDQSLKYKKRCIDLSSPQYVIDITDARIAEISRLLQNGDYLRTGPEWDYAEEFRIKSIEWYESVYVKLVEEIQEYNEKKYYEWKFSGFDEKQFKKWKDSSIMKKKKLEEEFETES